MSQCQGRPSESPLGNRLLRWVVAVGLAFVSAAWATSLASQSSSSDPTCYEENICDSLTFAVVAELLSDGKTPYVAQVRREHVSKTRLSGDAPPFDLPFQYPPNALPIFAIRSTLSPATAHAGLAFITTFICLVFVVRLVQRRLTDDLAAALLTLGIALSGVVALNAELGQTGLLAAGLVLGVVLSWVRVPLAAGLILGILAFKPQYAAPLLLVALVNRDWRIVTGASVAFAVLTLASGIAFGFSQWKWFLHSAATSSDPWPWMVNWSGLAWRITSENPDLTQAPSLPLFVVFVVALLVTAAGLWAVRERASIESQLSVAVTVAVFASPHTHPYDLLVLVPALVEVSRRSWGPSVGPIFFALTWLALPLPYRWVMVLGVIVLGACCLMPIGRAVFTTWAINRQRLAWRVAQRPS